MPSKSYTSLHNSYFGRINYYPMQIDHLCLYTSSCRANHVMNLTKNLLFSLLAAVVASLFFNLNLDG